MPNSIVLDDIPRPVWIVMTILGFIFFWPIGLMILAYLFWSGKMRCGHGGRSDWNAWKKRSGFYSNTGNRAFDDYRSETLKRLEDEEREFRTFVDRLRQAKDKEEFDRFMSERGQRSTPTGSVPSTPPNTSL
jgi:hypothetical protein